MTKLIAIFHNRAYRPATIVAELNGETLALQTEGVAKPIYNLLKLNAGREGCSFVQGVEGSIYIKTYAQNKLPKKWAKAMTGCSL